MICTRNLLVMRNYDTHIKKIDFLEELLFMVFKLANHDTAQTCFLQVFEKSPAVEFEFKKNVLLGSV